MKYTKKPVTIEAVKWDGFTFSEGPNETPWVQDALSKTVGEPGSVWFKRKPPYNGPQTLLVKTLHGPVDLSPGNYLVKTIYGDLYPHVGKMFDETHSEFQGLTPLQQLTKLQNEVGYVQGDINIIALLGLFGEAGEVLNEIFLIDNSEDDLKAEDLKMLAVETAKKIDNLKKIIRDKKPTNSLGINIGLSFVESSDDFEAELADCFYYLHALCINRGITLDKLAELAIMKVLTKQAQNISHGSNNN